MKLGDSFFTPQTATVERHLWVIVSDPAVHDDIVFANFSTKQGPNTSPCTVGPGEHPSLSQDSFVRCEEARRSPKADVQTLLTKGTLTATKPAPAELVTKMQKALGASDLTPLEAKELLHNQGLT